MFYFGKFFDIVMEEGIIIYIKVFIIFFQVEEI